MSDPKLRELERRYAVSGDPHDARLLERERKLLGLLTCGCPGETPEPPEPMTEITLRISEEALDNPLEALRAWLDSDYGDEP